jgi:hypothetical protein
VHELKEIGLVRADSNIQVFENKTKNPDETVQDSALVRTKPFLLRQNT